MRHRYAILMALFCAVLAASPAFAQCGVFKTWTFGERLDSADLNAAFQRTVDANTPGCVGDYSASVSQMQANTDPYPGSTESLATTLAGELERLRFQLKAVAGKSQWYHVIDNSLAKDTPKHWGATYTKFSEIADPASPGSNELALYAKDDGGGLTVLAYKDSAGNVNTLSGPATSYGNSVTINYQMIRNAGTPNTKLDLSADRISVQGRIKSGFSVTIDATTTGANALDAGSLGNDVRYFVWVIVNPTSNAFAGLLSEQETSPAMPSGYTLKRLMGSISTDSSGHFYAGTQRGNTWTFAAPYVFTSLSPQNPTQHDLAFQLPGQAASKAYFIVDTTTNVAAATKIHYQSFTAGGTTLNAPVNVWHDASARFATGPWMLPLNNPTDRTQVFIEVVSGGAATVNILLTGWEIQWRE